MIKKSWKLLIFLFFVLLFPKQVFAADYTTEVWKTVEIPLTSSKTYTDPIQNVDVLATFTKSGGPTIVRRAFWNGGTSWKIRFAPTATGTWAMTVSSNDSANAGFNGVTKTVQANAYAGSLEIYKRGFLKVSSDLKYFTYNDNTPFFYLGDTHWFINEENFTGCSIPNCTSQFKYVADKRLAQKFSVYQTEWLGITLQCSLTQTNLPNFQRVDEKMKYLSDLGYVTTVTVDWRDLAPKCPDSYLTNFGHYWSARYGSYPILWTVAQEVDDKYPQLNDPADMDTKWQIVGKALKDNDSYGTPLTAHMVNEDYVTATTSTWKDLPYHNWFGAQIQKPLTTAIAQNYYQNANKPTVLLEPPYEGYWTDRLGERSRAYSAFLSGWYGFGYGVVGIWNNRQTCEGSTEVCELWNEGLIRESGNDMTRLKDFFQSVSWWKLVPRFADQTWATFSNAATSRLASDGNNLYVAYFYNATSSTGTLKNMDPTGTYQAKWYNPRTGELVTINDSFTAPTGSWTIPLRPTAEDYILKVTKNTQKLGDANGDNQIDVADFSVWKSFYRQLTSLGSTVANFNGDGKTNALDFVIWAKHVGQ